MVLISLSFTIWVSVVYYLASFCMQILNNISSTGGGWCNDINNCAMRAEAKTLGSSDLWYEYVTCKGGGNFDPRGTSTSGTPYKGSYPCSDDGGMEGLFSYNSVENPLTWNWNKVYVPYCDGASFSGDVDEPVEVKDGGYRGSLYFRGHKILLAVYDSLLSTKGLDRASDAIISGSSAGGLTVYLHIDEIAGIIKHRSSARVVGIPDAGFFLDVPAYGTYHR